MRRRAAWLLISALAAPAAGCALPYHDAVMQGNVNEVVISYGGEVAKTLPLAQQFCARYERIPVLHETKENNAYYFCVRPSDAPHLTP